MIISSQRHLDYAIVDQKVDEISSLDRVVLRIVKAGEINGETAYILVDGHHTGEAARELDIEIAYEEVDAVAMGYSGNWTLEEWLENLWIDSDWYNYETGDLIY